MPGAGALSNLGQEPASWLARAQGEEVKTELRMRTDKAAGQGIFGAPTFNFERGLRVDTIDMAWSAAAQGLGLAVGRLPLTSGAFPWTACPGAHPSVRAKAGYWLTTAPATLERADVVAFRDWLVAKLDGLCGAEAQTPV